MGKIDRAVGTTAHYTISVPLHILLSIFTAGLWIPVWVIMEVRRRNRRRMEALQEEEVKLLRKQGRVPSAQIPPPINITPEMPPPNYFRPPDPYGPNGTFA